MAEAARRSARASSPTSSSSGVTSATRYGSRAWSTVSMAKRPRRRGKQVVAAIRVAARFADLDKRSDPGQRERPVRAHLPSVADQDDPERRSRVEAVPRQRPVAILEDVEGQDDAWTEDGVQREEGDLHRPSLRGPM